MFLLINQFHLLIITVACVQGCKFHLTVGGGDKYTLNKNINATLLFLPPFFMC